MSDYEDLPDSARIAVIGMSGRFPGAANLDEFWQNLCAGRESIRRFAPDELDPSVPQSLRQDPDYVPARGVLDGADEFDAAFFGISPREAEIMDPQCRVFLQEASAALDAAGYCSEKYAGMIGVYAGMANNSYYPSSVATRPDLIARIGEFQAMLANEKDFLATRVSHKLDLKGPSISLYTGCSTSLVATAQAFQSLLSYQCDIALAGGVSITCPQESGYLYREEGIESKDGHCRPFDAEASGTIFSNGVGVVVLKRLDEALEDGDHVHAVILGAGLNNDGADKVSFAAPSVAGQADVIAMAHAQGQVDPATVSFVEAHGTATLLGDPVEFEGLKRAFQYPKSGKQFCALGSVKGNFGHLLAAAGVTGLIKTVLALENGCIPPLVNHRSPNPRIDFAKSPFYVNQDLLPWDSTGEPRRAGVSSFGIGGTNAHLVLEEAPKPVVQEPPAHAQLLRLSAKTEGALLRMKQKLAKDLASRPGTSIADVAMTLQSGRRDFEQRSILLAATCEEASENLMAEDAPWAADGQASGSSSEVVFFFPGQGSQYGRMGESLYANAPVYRSHIDECADALQGMGLGDIRQSLYTRDAASESEMAGTVLAHAGIFITEYALAQLWMSWGVQPKLVIGHSIGEFVGACIAGVFSAGDALRLLVARARLIENTAPGAMLAVRLSATDLRERLHAGLELAADNAPLLSVATGPVDLISALSAELLAAEIPCQQLAANRAMHSQSLRETVAALNPVAAEIRFSRPRFRWLSTVRGSWVHPNEVADAAYWTQHACDPVRFRDAIECLGEDEDRLGIEVGPGTALANFARQTLGRPQKLVSSLPESWTSADFEWRTLVNAAGRLWLAGLLVDCNSGRQLGARRTPLPGYPFERTKFWLPAATSPIGPE